MNTSLPWTSNPVACHDSAAHSAWVLGMGEDGQVRNKSVFFLQSHLIPRSDPQVSHPHLGTWEQEYHGRITNCGFTHYSNDVTLCLNLL